MFTHADYVFHTFSQSSGRNAAAANASASGSLGTSVANVRKYCVCAI